ncbi:Unknown protein, partial [Striga hermonthica]
RAQPCQGRPASVRTTSQLANQLASARSCQAAPVSAALGRPLAEPVTDCPIQPTGSLVQTGSDRLDRFSQHFSVSVPVHDFSINF